MFGTLFGITLIVAGGALALLYRYWAKTDAESLKKMSERRSKRSYPAKAPAAHGERTGTTQGKSSTRATFGRR